MEALERRQLMRCAQKKNSHSNETKEGTSSSILIYPKRIIHEGLAWLLCDRLLSFQRLGARLGEPRTHANQQPSDPIHQRILLFIFLLTRSNWIEIISSNRELSKQNATPSKVRLIQYRHYPSPIIRDVGGLGKRGDTHTLIDFNRRKMLVPVE